MRVEAEKRKKRCRKEKITKKNRKPKCAPLGNKECEENEEEREERKMETWTYARRVIAT